MTIGPSGGPAGSPPPATPAPAGDAAPGPLTAPGVPPRAEPPRTEHARTEQPAYVATPTPTQTATAARPAAPVTAPLKGKPKRAKLVVRRVDPWSVLKFSLLFSLCLFVVLVVAVAALYYALDGLGVFKSVNEFIRQVTESNTGGKSTGGFDVTFSAGGTIGSAAVIGLIDVVIITAVSTLGAFLYNLCADIVGGIEVTLAERE